MANTNTCLKTKQLIISPESENVWTCKWTISTQQEPGKKIGAIGFNGIPQNGQVELWYEITEEQKDNDYIIETINKIIRWAFKQKNVYRINTDSKCDWEMLQYIDFEFQKSEENKNPIFYIDKHKPYWSFIGIILGAFIGESLCFILLKTCGQDNYKLYNSLSFIGAIIGAGLGEFLAKKEMKRRENIINGKL